MSTSFSRPQSGSAVAGDSPGFSSLGAIRRVSLKDKAVQRICHVIERRELKAGEIVTELGLARKLGVGQPAIREALLEVEFVGYVESMACRKTRVTYLTKRSIDDIYLVRTRLDDVQLSGFEESLRLRGWTR